MKNSAEFLQDAIGFIGDDLIMNAQAPKKRFYAFQKYMAIAACFVIVAVTTATSALLFGMFSQTTPFPIPSLSTSNTIPPLSHLEVAGYWHNGESSESAVYLSPDYSFVYYTLVPTSTPGIYDVNEQYGSYEMSGEQLVLSMDEKNYVFAINAAENGELIAVGENELGNFTVKSDSLPQNFLLEFLGGIWICGNPVDGTLEDTAYYFSGDGYYSVISFSLAKSETDIYSFDGETLILYGDETKEISYSDGDLYVTQGGKKLKYYRASLAHSYRLGISAGNETLTCPAMYLETLIWDEETQITFTLPEFEIFKTLTPFIMEEEPRFIISHRGDLSYTLYSEKSAEPLYENNISFIKPKEAGIYYLDVRFISDNTDIICNGRILHYYITIEVK